MADVIVRVTPSSGRVALTDLIAAPLGLDVWEV